MESIFPPLIGLYEEPLIQFVDHMIHHAHQQGASDIHIEPQENTIRLRYRQDGLLYEVAQIQPHWALRIITRLKVMADLDISERRQPQDGHFQISAPQHQTLDVRISSCPTLHGEKIVLRLLDNSQLVFALDKLGFTGLQKELFLKKISQPQGLILVTGPTGSGKTITLYSALDYLNVKEKNILTIEDPIEIQLEGLNQVPLNTKVGLDFATTLRAFLRQDPDIIMVGEIRDLETAKIAIQAAQTGHLVLSTLHTNSAVETVTRLLSMGIDPYQVAQALTLIIAQRLIRKLCPLCKQAETAPLITEGEQKNKGYRASGCPCCRYGYKGRIAIFECLDLSEALIPLLSNNMDINLLVKAAQAEGFKTLRENGLEKIRQGETSFAELNRVILR